VAKTLGEVAEIVMGQSPPGGTCNDRGEGVPLLNGPTEFGPHHPSPVQFTTDARKLARTGDILFCVRGSTTGRMNWADREYAIGRGVAAIRHRTRPHLQPLVRGVIEGELRGLLAQATGSTFPNVSARQLSDLTWPPIPEDEQLAIATMVGALDDKIDLNRRMSVTLAEIARAIFKAWFVDFDPIRAKAEGRDLGLPNPITDLFPDGLLESDIGQIPEGWQAEPLGDHIEVVRGLSYRGASLVGEREGLPLHNLNSVLEGGGYKYEGIKWYAGEYKGRHLAKPGDLIVANTEQGHNHLLIGCPAIVPGTFGHDALFSHHLYRVRALESSPLTRLFIYHLLLERRMRNEVIGYTHGTTVNMLSVDGLKHPRFAVPPADLVAAFEGLVGPMFKRSEHLIGEVRTLAALRDTLLPKLISGEIRVATEAA